jgi:hypothetical protein
LGGRDTVGEASGEALVGIAGCVLEVGVGVAGQGIGVRNEIEESGGIGGDAGPGPGGVDLEGGLSSSRMLASS